MAKFLFRISEIHIKAIKYDFVQLLMHFINCHEIDNHQRITLKSSYVLLFPPRRYFLIGVCLLAGLRKTTQRIFTKFGGKVTHGPWKTPLDFGNPDYVMLALGLWLTFRVAVTPVTVWRCITAKKNCKGRPRPSLAKLFCDTNTDARSVCGS